MDKQTAGAIRNLLVMLTDNFLKRATGTSVDRVNDLLMVASTVHLAMTAGEWPAPLGGEPAGSSIPPALDKLVSAITVGVNRLSAAIEKLIAQLSQPGFGQVGD